jgi:chorismate mutase
MITLTTRLIRWATTDNLIDAATTTAAALGVLFVTLAGIVLSFTALLDLARAAGSISPALTWLWPLTLDALAVVASLNVLWAEIRKERDRYAWSLVIAFTLLSVVFNAVHASLTNLLALHPLAPAAVSGFVGILPPIAAAFALHLLVRLLRRVLIRVSVLAGLADLRNQVSQAAANLARLQAEADAMRAALDHQIADLTARRNALQSDLAELRKEKRREGVGAPAETSPSVIERAKNILAQRGDISGSELGRLLGRSESLGRRLKQQLAPAVATNGSGRLIEADHTL